MAPRFIKSKFIEGIFPSRQLAGHFSAVTFSKYSVSELCSG